LPWIAAGVVLGASGLCGPGWWWLALFVAPLSAWGAARFPHAARAGIGLAAFVRLLRWLLERWHGQTVALLVGVMAGSLWKIWPFRTVLESTTNAKGKLVVLRDALAAPPDGAALLAALLLGAVGVALVVGLEWLQQRAGVAEMGG
jgi:putative membrane protein